MCIYTHPTIHIQDQDHYVLLGLGRMRWRATQQDIRKACESLHITCWTRVCVSVVCVLCVVCAVCVVCVDRQKVLVHHPDKKQQVALAVGEGEGEGEGDDHFKCIKIGETKDCTHKWIGNAVQNFSSSNFFSGHIVRVREKSV